jgi:hypothetical protein
MWRHKRNGSMGSVATWQSFCRPETCSNFDTVRIIVAFTILYHKAARERHSSGYICCRPVMMQEVRGYSMDIREPHLRCSPVRRRCGRVKCKLKAPRPSGAGRPVLQNSSTGWAHCLRGRSLRPAYAEFWRQVGRSGSISFGVCRLLSLRRQPSWSEIDSALGERRDAHAANG